MWEDRDKISGQSIAKSLISMAIPAVLSTFFMVVFEIIDMFWIGKLGGLYIAAMSSASFFIWMLRGLSLTIATGAIALVSRRVGEKNEEALLETIKHTIFAAFIYSLLIIALFFPIVLNVFRWIKIDPAVGALSTEFALIFLSGIIFPYFMATFEFIIRGTGNTRIPMMIMGFTLLLNTILAPIFIFEFGMGMKGGAYATICSQGIGAFLMGIALFKRLPQLKRIIVSFTSEKIRKFFRQFLAIVKIGGLVAISDAGFSVIYLLLSGIISIFGREPLAAVGISHRLEGLPFFISLGFSMAVAPMVGQYLGAGEIERAKKTASLSLKITSSVMVVISVVYYIFAPYMFRFFTPEPLIIHYGVQYIRIVILFEVFLAFEVVLDGVFSGAGDTRPPFLIVLPVTFLRIPLSYFFAVTLNIGTIAIWAVIGVTTFIKGILLFRIFKKGKWASKKI